MNKAKSRKRLDPVKTRAQILEAAILAFAAKGFDGASVAEISLGAGVTKSLVQYHFGSKEELWHECVANLAAPVLAVLDRFVAGEATMEDVLRIRFKLFQEHPEAGRILAWTSLGGNPLPAAFMQRKPRLVQAFGSRPGKPMLLMMFALASLDGWFLFRNLYRHVAGEELFDPKVDALLLETIIGMAKGEDNELRSDLRL